MDYDVEALPVTSIGENPEEILSANTEEASSIDIQSPKNNSEKPCTSAFALNPPFVEESEPSTEEAYALPLKKSTKRKSSCKGSSKKRKKNFEADWSQDSDFTVSKKKAKKAGKNSFDAEERESLEEFVEKRRSGRLKSEKANKAVYEDERDDFDLQFEENKGEVVHEKDPLEEWIVEKILGLRMGVRKKLADESKESEDTTKSSQTKHEEDADVKDTLTDHGNEPDVSLSASEKIGAIELKEDDAAGSQIVQEKNEAGEQVKEEEIEVEELYIKYKGRSYLHCQWRTVDELERFDKRIIAKLNRYKIKNNGDVIDFDDVDYFPKSYSEVGRILDEVYDEAEEGTYVFVKWRGYKIFFSINLGNIINLGFIKFKDDLFF